MNIQVLIKKQYGKEFFEPLSDDAKALCKIAKVDNLVLWQLEICDKMGWSVDIQSKKYSIKEMLGQ